MDVDKAMKSLVSFVAFVVIGLIIDVFIPLLFQATNISI
jgi:hypothetical protein